MSVASVRIIRQIPSVDALFFVEMSSTELEKWIPTVGPKDNFMLVLSQNCQSSDPKIRPTVSGKEACVSTNGITAQITQPNTGWVS
jgi:hypothetical protein